MVYMNEERLVTAREFWEIVQQPSKLKHRRELIRGVVVDVSPSSQLNTVTAGRIAYFLNQHVIPLGIGYITTADGMFRLSNLNVRLADVAYISKARHPHLTTGAFPIAPDLAVEIVSENDSASEVRNKVRIYLESSTTLVWVVYPDVQSVDVHRLDEHGNTLVQTVTSDGILDGGKVLPDFKLPVKDIFPD